MSGPDSKAEAPVRVPAVLKAAAVTTPDAVDRPPAPITTDAALMVPVAVTA